MECFDAKLLLRRKNQRHGQNYPVDLFGHLCVCRNCWTYANYLWHKETREVTSRYGLDRDEYEERLDLAWAGRRSRPSPLWRRPLAANAMQFMVLAMGGMIFFLL